MKFNIRDNGYPISKEKTISKRHSLSVHDDHKNEVEIFQKSQANVLLNMYR